MKLHVLRKNWILFGLALFGVIHAHDEFPFDPPKNFTLNTKYILLKHPVTTQQLTAQLYFDQGLTLMYAFNHDAAYWSFLKAAEADPQLAMAYWGQALALGPNINMDISIEREQKAYKAIQKASDLSKNATEAERDYIKALSARYSNDPNADLKQLAQDYCAQMRILKNKYPDDPDAAVLFAESLMDLHPWRLWNPDGKPLEGTQEAVDTLENVIKNDPLNLGANHYYIHLVESSKNPERALMSAERLTTLMPASGHILHMPSHIYILLGDFHKAALSNEEAVIVDQAYIREYGLTGIYPMHYLTHNLNFLSRSYSMEGRFEDARRAAKEMESFYVPHYHHMPELEYYASTPLFTLVRFNRWADILKSPEPSAQMPMAHLLWHFCRGVAFAKQGNVQEALNERNKFTEETSKISPTMSWGYNKAVDINKIAQNVLDARIAEAQGNQAKAVEYLKAAIAAQDALNYNEPPDWFFPVRESLGGLYLRMKKYPPAEKIFREDLKLHPRNGRSLFGLMESLKAQSKTHDLYWVENEFNKAWLYSTTPLSVKDL